MKDVIKVILFIVLFFLFGGCKMHMHTLDNLPSEVFAAVLEFLIEEAEEGLKNSVLLEAIKIQVNSQTNLGELDVGNAVVQFKADVKDGFIAVEAVIQYKDMFVIERYFFLVSKKYNDNYRVVEAGGHFGWYTPEVK